MQAQALPAVLSGRDVIGIAKTGSGKTLGRWAVCMLAWVWMDAGLSGICSALSLTLTCLGFHPTTPAAFVWPAVVHLMDQHELEPGAYIPTYLFV